MEEEVLEIAKSKCEGADVVTAKWDNVGVSYEASEIDEIASDESWFLGLRVIKNGKLGIAHTYDLNFDPEDLVERAINNAKYGPKSFFDIPQKVVATDPKAYHKSVLDMTPGKMKTFSETEMGKMLKSEKDILVDVGMSKAVYSSRFINSNGTDYSEKSARVSFMIGGSRMEEGDLLQLYSSESSRKMEDKLKDPTKELIKLFKSSKNISKLKTGKYDIYFHPRAFVDIFQTITGAMNGKSVLLGSSYLKDSLGQKSFDKKINIYEDPLLDWAPNSSGVDDEGVKTAKKDIIKDGVPKQFIYDLQTAGKAKTKSTGNGFRGIGSQASPGFTNLIMQGGDKKEAEIIQNIKRGIYIRGTLGGHTNDPLSGNISLQCWIAFKIENGKIVGRVKDSMIFLNAFEALKSNVLEVSADRKWIGNKYLPGVLLKDISTSAK